MLPVKTIRGRANSVMRCGSIDNINDETLPIKTRRENVNSNMRRRSIDNIND